METTGEIRDRKRGKKRKENEMATKGETTKIKEERDKKKKTR